MKYMMDKDIETRIESTKLYYSYFEENEDKFDSLFDKLVSVRDKMAKKLGYKSELIKNIRGFGYVFGR